MGKDGDHNIVLLAPVNPWDQAFQDKSVGEKVFHMLFIYSFFHLNYEHRLMGSEIYVSFYEYKYEDKSIEYKAIRLSFLTGWGCLSLK